MKSFIQLTSGEKQYLLATSAIAAVSKNGEGCLITLNTVVDGFDPITKAASFDVPFEDIVSRLATDIVELKKPSKRNGSWGVTVVS